MNSGSGNFTQVLIVALIVAVAGATGYMLLANQTEPDQAVINQNNLTDLDLLNERAAENVAELPVNDSNVEETRLAGDPALESMSPEELASEGAPVLDLPEVGDEVMVDSEVSVPLPLAAGSFEDYSPEKLALAETGTVILHFSADWCPSCRALEKDITTNLNSIPDGVHILKVDYDTETALKKKYGVVRQHTLVQVDASGNQIQTLTGLVNTLDQVVAQVN